MSASKFQSQGWAHSRTSRKTDRLELLSRALKVGARYPKTRTMFLPQYFAWLRNRPRRSFTVPWGK